MKKEILIGAIALLLGAGVTAQTTEPVQTQTKTRKQLKTETRQQAQVQDQTQSGDPIMTNAQTRTRDQKKEKVRNQTGSGDPIMTQTRTRAENHGAAVSETARQTPGGEGKGAIVSQQARTNGEARRAARQAKKLNKNQGAVKSVRTNRPATGKSTGAGRK